MVVAAVTGVEHDAVEAVRRLVRAPTRAPATSAATRRGHRDRASCVRCDCSAHCDPPPARNLPNGVARPPGSDRREQRRRLRLPRARDARLRRATCRLTRSPTLATPCCVARDLEQLEQRARRRLGIAERAVAPAIRDAEARARACRGRSARARAAGAARDAACRRSARTTAAARVARRRARRSARRTTRCARRRPRPASPRPRRGSRGSRGERRRAVDHAAVDAGEARDEGRNRRARIDQRVEASRPRAARGCAPRRSRGSCTARPRARWSRGRRRRSARPSSGAAATGPSKSRGSSRTATRSGSRSARAAERRGEQPARERRRRAARAATSSRCASSATGSVASAASRRSSTRRSGGPSASDTVRTSKRKDESQRGWRASYDARHRERRKRGRRASVGRVVSRAMRRRCSARDRAGSRARQRRHAGARGASFGRARALRRRAGTRARAPCSSSTTAQGPSPSAPRIPSTPRSSPRRRSSSSSSAARRERAADARRLLTPLGVGFAETGRHAAQRLRRVRARCAAGRRARRSLPRPSAARARRTCSGSRRRTRRPGSGRRATCEEASDEKLEIELDVAHDLRGWGGAPVVARDGRVVGIVQAAQPSGKTMRVLATPIAAVLESLALPLDGGRGRAFAALAGACRRRRRRRRAVAAPAPAPAPSRAKRSRRSCGRSARSVPSRSRSIIRNDGAVIGGRDADRLRRRSRARAAQRRPHHRRGLRDRRLGFDRRAERRRRERQRRRRRRAARRGGRPLRARQRRSGRLDPRRRDRGRAAPAVAPRSPLHARRARHLLRADARRTAILDDHPAVTEIALTTDYDDVQHALDRVLARGPGGATFMAAGIDQATNEVRGERGAFSRADPNSQKVIVFLTDGHPDAALRGRRPAQHRRRGARGGARARGAARASSAFGVGEEALSGPLALLELARITDGAFTPVRDPALLSDVFARSRVRRHRGAARAQRDARSARAGDRARRRRLLRLVRPAARRAQCDRGDRAAAPTAAARPRTVTVEFAPDGAAAAVPADLVAIQNRLLEMRLAQLRRDRIAGEQERVERAAREARARDRARAREGRGDRAEQQRKKLEVKVEREDGTEPGAAP